MNYKLVCKECSCYGWVSNVDLDEGKPKEWLFKDANGETDLYEGPCDHDDYDIVDQEYDDSHLEPGY
jgi:hypothetical protein